MNTDKIIKRLEALEQKALSEEVGLLTVFYKDGSSRRVFGCEAVLLSLEESDKIERFEEVGEGNGHILEGLVNVLLK